MLRDVNSKALITTRPVNGINRIKSETRTNGETRQDENDASGSNSIVAEQFSRDSAQCS